MHTISKADRTRATRSACATRDARTVRDARTARRTDLARTRKDTYV